MSDEANSIDPGLINYADYLLREWGKWGRGEEMPKGYAQVLGVRRSVSHSLTDEEAARIDSAISGLDSIDRDIIRGVYLRSARIKSRAGWRNALRAFADRFEGPATQEASEAA